MSVLSKHQIDAPAPEEYADRRMEVSFSQFCEFMGGHTTAEIARRVAREANDSRSQVSRWLRALQLAAEHPFDVDWQALSQNGTGDASEKEEAHYIATSFPPEEETEAGYR